MFSLKKEERRDNASCVISPFYFIFMYFERLFASLRKGQKIMVLASYRSARRTCHKAASAHLP